MYAIRSYYAAHGAVPERLHPAGVGGDHAAYCGGAARRQVDPGTEGDSMKNKTDYSKLLLKFSEGKYSYGDYLNVRRWFADSKEDKHVEEVLFA